jgi:hypothetical protein
MGNEVGQPYANCKPPKKLARPEFFPFLKKASLGKSIFDLLFAHHNHPSNQPLFNQYGEIHQLSRSVPEHGSCH